MFKVQHERKINSAILHKGVAGEICPGGVDMNLLITFNILEILVFLENFGYL